MTDNAQQSVSNSRKCGACGDKYHSMSVFNAPATAYGWVCVGCVSFFLTKGRWPESKEDRVHNV